MKKLHMLLAVLREFGLRWMIDRGLYSLKLRLLGLCPAAGRLFEKAPPYPVRTDLFRVDVSALRSILSELDEADRRQLIEICLDLLLEDRIGLLQRKSIGMRLRAEYAERRFQLCQHEAERMAE